MPYISCNRKSAPCVRRGKVQKQNRTALSPDVYEQELAEFVFRRDRPLKGWYHPASIRDVQRFMSVIPDWQRLSMGLRAVILRSGNWWRYGQYNTAGVIGLEAWPRDEEQSFRQDDRWLLDQLGVELNESGYGLLTPEQAKGFVLLSTFLHEVGHHVDRMSTRSKADAANGEPFAIRFEQSRQRELWQAYVREFGEPC